MENINDKNCSPSCPANTENTENSGDNNAPTPKAQPENTPPVELKELPKNLKLTMSQSDAARLQAMQLLNEDVDFVADSRAALVGKAPPCIKIALYILGAFIFAITTWFSFAKLDEVTYGIGKVVPSSQVQIIQNLEGGILSAIYVHEGDDVKKGQLLAKLDDTIFKSQYSQAFAKSITLQAAIARLLAETEGKTQVTFPPEVLQNPSLVAHETKLFNSRRQTLQINVENLQKTYKLAQDELKITEPLVAQKVISNIEFLRLQRDITSIKSKLDDYQNGDTQQSLTELTKARSDFSMIQEELLGLKDRMQRTALYSPVNGIVKQIYLNTVGGILKPAVPIMEIVPIDDQLIIEAHIAPADIGFIKIGQPADVKITAYDYSIYGALKGLVTRISADSTTDEKGNSFYEIGVKTDKSYLGDNKNNFRIIPGMQASVDILTGKRSIMRYILKPIFRAQEKALHER